MIGEILGGGIITVWLALCLAVGVGASLAVWYGILSVLGGLTAIPYVGRVLNVLLGGVLVAGSAAILGGWVYAGFRVAHEANSYTEFCGLFSMGALAAGLVGAGLLQLAKG